MQVSFHARLLAHLNPDIQYHSQLDHYFSKCAQASNPKHILTRDKLPTMLGGIDYKLQKSQFDDLNEDLYE
jgi:hypothetical protein